MKLNHPASNDHIPADFAISKIWPMVEKDEYPPFKEITGYGPFFISLYKLRKQLKIHNDVLWVMPSDNDKLRLVVPAEFWAAGLSDRVGRKRVYLWGAALSGIWAFALFPLVDTGNIYIVRKPTNCIKTWRHWIYTSRYNSSMSWPYPI